MTPREMLRKNVEQSGGVRKAAVALGVSPQYVSAALLGRRAFGPKMLKALGLKRVITVA